MLFTALVLRVRSRKIFFYFQDFSGIIPGRLWRIFSQHRYIFLYPSLISSVHSSVHFLIYPEKSWFLFREKFTACTIQPYACYFNQNPKGRLVSRQTTSIGELHSRWQLLLPLFYSFSDSTRKHLPRTVSRASSTMFRRLFCSTSNRAGASTSVLSWAKAQLTHLHHNLLYALTILDLLPSTMKNPSSQRSKMWRCN